jgi:hypothetical protein
MSTVEIEPRLPEGRVKEWRRRHDSTVKSLVAPSETQVKTRVVEKKEKKPGKNILRRGWDAIPTPVKVIGGIALAALLSQYFFQFMRDQHGEIGKRTVAAGHGVGGSVQGSNVTSGQTGAGSPLGAPGTGIINRNPNIAGSSDRPVPQDPGDK